MAEPLDWSQLRQTAKNDLVCLGKTAKNEYIASLPRCENANPSEITKLLTSCYAHYSHLDTRKAVATVLEQYLDDDNHKEEVAAAIAQRATQVGKIKVSSVQGTLLVLEWVCMTIQRAPRAACIDTLIESQSVLLHNLMVEYDKKARTGSAAIRNCKNAVSRAAVYDFEVIDKYLKLLTAKSHPQATAHLTLIGVLAGAATDLKLDEAEAKVQSYKQEILDLYIHTFLGAKHALESSVVETLVPFLSDYLVQEDLDNVLMPAVGKAMLRSPEAVLKTTVPSLFASLSPLVDLTPSLNEKLSSFISAFSSSNATVREGAQRTVLVALEHCHGDLSPIAEKLFTGLKKVSNPDQKVVYGRVLNHIRSTEKLATEIPAALLPLAGKETNEGVLQQYTEALFKHVIQGLEQFDVQPDQGVVDAATKGMEDKRLNLQRVWVCSFVNQVLDYTRSTSSKSAELLVQMSTKLRASFDRVLANVNSAVQNKFVSAGYAYIAIANKVEDSEALQKALSTQLGTSRVFAKLSGDDFYWAIKANAALIAELGTDDLNWGLSWVYFCLSKNVPVATRRAALLALRDLYNDHPDKVGPLIIHTITKLLAGTTECEDESLIPVDGLGTIVTHLFSQYKSNTKAEVAEQHLADAAIICHHAKARPSNGWIGLVQRAGLDPGVLVEKHYQRIVENVANTDTALFHVACEAASSCCFINPDVVVPQVVELMNSKLDLDTVDGLTDFEIKVWRTPEGEIALEDDEEAKKRQYVDNKNDKDYETRKWEESIRKKQAEQKPKKLTKQEQQQLNDQAQTRGKVDRLVKVLQLGLQVVTVLSQNAEAVDNGVDQWFHHCLRKLSALLRDSKAFKLVGKEATDAFIQLSRNLSSRLGQIRPFIAVCMLRSLYNADHVPSHMVEEPLKELAERILYRLKFLSDQRPLDSATLIFIVPLLLQAIKYKGGIGTKKEDELEEQVVLALGVITTHAEEFVNVNTPRSDLLTSLIQLMQSNPTKAKQAKEALMSIVQSVAINYNSEELSILLEAVLSGDVFIRTAVLEAIDSEMDLSTCDSKFQRQIWIAKFDDELINRDLANDIWTENEMELVDDASDQIVELLSSHHDSLRRAAGRAAAAVVEQDGSKFHHLFDKLVELYNMMIQPPPPVYDRFGIQVKTKTADRWFARSGVGITLEQLAPFFDSAKVQELFEFMINAAHPALDDPNHQTASEMQQAALEVINRHGLQNVEQLIPVFEKYLAKPDKETSDQVSQSTIILYGALARHLKSDDSRLTTIVERLMSTLDSPSEDVQYAVSKCLPPLVPLFDSQQLQAYINDKLMAKLFDKSSTLAQRRGAAYGISGLIKGTGISALADYDVIRELTEALEDKKDPKRRQGAQFAFECLSQSLGRFFEPYVIELLPLVLSCLGDRDQDVREATNYAARMIMKSTTGYGIKKLIPLALENLDSTAWRAKKGSVELLGTMAYLDPQQLSSSLSTVIPEIVGVLNDTHKEVRGAASDSLKRFGEVIRNPEIQTLVPVLIKAIGNPTKYTDDALDGLLKTQFVHYIDAPSLALVVYVIHRGLKDRSAATKKKACQIVGNMSILTDSEDLVPYLDSLVEELQVAMVDPVPGTRATASRALGALVEKLGEERFPHLISDLMAVLRDEKRAGDRLGSAQALSEVLFGLGIRKLEELLPVILKNCTSTKPWIREGFMPLMIYLPNCFGASLSPYLSQIIPPILTGLADAVDNVRDTALKAGRLLVRNYSNKAVDLLLPELERGLSDVNHRIRLSSVELTGDLLYQVTGISSSGGDEQDSAVAGQINKALGDVLGVERRARILSSLFLCRSDTSGQVRTASIEVWKSLVSNTPRTVKEILPTLTQMVIRRLASSDEEHRNIGAQTLGELVRRVGSNALSELLPTLQNGLASSDSDAKQGICIALSELITSASEDSLAEYQPTIVSVIREALADSDPAVRESAAGAFDTLQETVGNSAVDQIMPHLIQKMQQEGANSNAFYALKEMMATKSAVVFPILIPTLLTPPMDAFKASALGSLATVSGTALYKRLSSIINALVDALTTNDDQEISDALDTVLLAVVHEEGVHVLMQQLISLGKHEDNRKRQLTFKHLATFFKESTSLNYSMYVEDWVAMLIAALDERDDQVVLGAWQALSALIAKTAKSEQLDLVRVCRNTLRQTGRPQQPLPGFELPKGPSCILPVFLQGLMYGSNDQREASALGLADIVERTDADKLKPYVTQMVGPLIRTIGERFPSDVKAAILYTLNVLLKKIPQFLKPFLPQLQRTFAKSLSDPSNETLRNRAAKALGTLITLQARIDPLVAELIAGARGSTDEGVTAAMHDALAEIVTKAGANLSDASKSSLVVFVNEQVPGTSDARKLLVLAQCLGGVVAVLENDESGKIVKNLMHDNTDFAILAINSILKLGGGGDKMKQCGVDDELRQYMTEHAVSDSSFKSEHALLALGKYAVGTTEASLTPNEVEAVVTTLSTCMAKTEARSPDARRLALVVTRTLARTRYDLFVKPYLDTLVLAVFGCVRDTIIPVKLAAEKCYLNVLSLVAEQGAGCPTFEQWFEHAQSDNVFTTVQPRSVGDYTKRVAMRLAASVKDRMDAGGDEGDVYSDEREDEQEIWSVGRTEAE